MIRPVGHRGNSYLIVLVMTALIAAMVAAAMSMVDQAETEISNTVGKYWQTALASDLAASLQMRETCNLMLTTGVFNPGTAPGAIVPARISWRVDDVPAGRPQRIEANTTLSDYKMRVRALQFENIINVGRLSGVRTLYTGALMLDAVSTLNNRAMRPVKVSDLYLEVEGGVVRNCYGVSQSLDLAVNMCTAIGGIQRTDDSGQPAGCYMRPNLPPTSCPAGKYLQGFDGAGSPGTCVDFR